MNYTESEYTESDKAAERRLFFAQNLGTGCQPAARQQHVSSTAPHYPRGCSRQHVTARRRETRSPHCGSTSPAARHYPGIMRHHTITLPLTYSTLDPFPHYPGIMVSPANHASNLVVSHLGAYLRGVRLHHGTTYRHQPRPRAYDRCVVLSRSQGRSNPPH